MDVLQETCKFVSQPQFEGFSSEPYQKTDRPTIGYGTTYYEDGTAVTLDDPPIDEARAWQLLEHWVGKALAKVDVDVSVDLTDNQRVALGSFVYNVGHIGETMLRKLNAGDYAGAAAEFPRWDHCNGVVEPGLEKRRLAEKFLFES